MKAHESLRFQVTGSNDDEIRTNALKHIAIYSNTVDGWTFDLEVRPIQTIGRPAALWVADVEAWR